MASFRYRDRGSSGTGVALSVAAGALVGFVAGVFVAQRAGGFAALTAKLRERLGRGSADDYDAELDGGEDEFEGEEEATYSTASLEERVLEAYMNDPILSERAVDIGEIGEGIIELAGWVETEDEADHAVTLARGVPGVDTVVNRLNVGEEEEMLEENYERFSTGDDALNEARWEGQGLGTGRRRQGSSAEVDRHADPRVPIQDKWLSEQAAIDNSAEPTEEIVAERRSRAKKGAQRADRTGGAPVAPTGVPKGDHVADPIEAQRLSEASDPATMQQNPPNLRAD
ncbi:MAG TPA: BON domain-containing protein [Gemmatimonadaceae bacterium]|nr:BON domain-containing protein [Gemmatimonadaceae bacterium]